MGLFSQLPEDPAEWAGLPSEPQKPETDAERLRDGLTIGGLDGDLVSSGTAATFIEIPVSMPAVIDDADGD